MSSRYDLETTIQLPDEDDVDVYIEFEVSSWGSPGSAPTLSYPGDPPEPAEYHITKVIRDDNDEDITAEVLGLPDEYRQKVEGRVFDRLCEIQEDHYND